MKIAVNINNAPCYYVETDKNNHLIFSNKVALGLAEDCRYRCDFSNPPDAFKKMEFYKFIIQSIGHGLMINGAYFPYTSIEECESEEDDNKGLDIHVDGAQVNEVEVQEQQGAEIESKLESIAQSTEQPRASLPELDMSLEEEEYDHLY